MQATVQCSAARGVSAPRVAVRSPSSSSQFSGTCLPRICLRANTRQPCRQVVRMGLFGLGVPEIAVIAGVVALVFGPAKLPELGKGLGKTVKSFQSAAKEFEQELKDGMSDEPLEEGAAKKEQEPKQ